MLFNYLIPIIIIVISNIIYHTTTKNIPKQSNSLLSLAVTYLIGMIITVLMYLITSKPSNIVADIYKLNWTSYILGLAVVGIEMGYIYMYRIGWNISKGSLVASTIGAILLIIIGILFYKEHIGLYQIVGIVCCIIGLILININ